MDTASKIHTSPLNARTSNIVIFRSPLSELGGLLTTLLLAVAAIYLSYLWPWALQEIPLGNILGKDWSITLPLFAIAPIITLANTMHSLYNYRYVLCDEYVLEIQGLLALSRKSVRANYIHIRGIEIDESFFQRIFGLGDLQLLGVAGGHGEPTLTIRGIAAPRRVKDLIQSRIQSHINSLSIAPLT